MTGNVPSHGYQPMVRRRFLVIVLFAVAMAWLEAAVVFYLRTLAHRIEPYQPNPLPIAGDIGGAELVREAATLAMLLTVGWLAGGSGRSRFGYFVAAFGVWDIFYYVFLIPLTGWPHSLFDWDILFLLPLLWWGPVLAPVMIAALMIVGGAVPAGNDARGGAPLWPAKDPRWIWCGSGSRGRNRTGAHAEPQRTQRKLLSRTKLRVLRVSA